MRHDLKASELRYRRLFETAQDGILLVDFDTGMIVDVNPFLIKMLGYSKDVFLKRHLWEVGVFKDITASRDNFKTLQEKGYVRFEDLPLETKTGDKIDVEFVANAYKVDGESIIQCNIRDITARKKAEVLLTESENRFRQMFENGHIGIFLTDKNFKFIKANPYICKLLGYTERELIRKKFSDITYSETVSQDIEGAKKLLQGKIQVYKNEKRYIKKNGEVIWVSIVVSVVRNPDKSFLYFLVMVENIDSRKKAEELLKNSEDKFTRVFESSPYALSVTRMSDGKFVDVNDAFTLLSGISRKEALETSSLKLGVWSNKDDRQEMLKELKINGLVKSREFPFKTKSRGVVMGLYSARVIDISGEPHILSSIADISELKKAEEQIIELKDKNDAILTSIGDAVFACDKDGKVLLFNTAAETLTGIPARRIVGQKYDKVITFLKESDEKPVSDFVHEVIKRNEIIKNLNHTLLVSATGKKIPVVNSVAPIRKATGDVVGCVVSFRDITVERDIDRAKTEFVSLASHQLRTPLTAINWYCEMLLSEDHDKLTKRQRTYTKETYRASKRMVALMDSLLNVSRLEMGTFIVEPKIVNIVKLARMCVKEINPLLSKKEINVHEKYDKQIEFIHADPKLLTIVIQNLLSNAVKYSRPRGVIELTIDKRDNNVVISVVDSGIGIPKDQQDLIFTKLFRADNARQTDPDGTGLGLYIAKNIMEKSGGKVWFESKEGHGSKFYASLPLTGMTRKGGTKELI